MRRFKQDSYELEQNPPKYYRYYKTVKNADDFAELPEYVKYMAFRIPYMTIGHMKKTKIYKPTQFPGNLDPINHKELVKKMYELERIYCRNAAIHDPTQKFNWINYRLK